MAERTYEIHRENGRAIFYALRPAAIKVPVALRQGKRVDTRRPVLGTGLDDIEMGQEKNRLHHSRRCAAESCDEVLLSLAWSDHLNVPIGKASGPQSARQCFRRASCPTPDSVVLIAISS